jgi:hypothetical protein
MRNVFLTNWQTSATGLIVIALGAAKTFLGIEVPGFSLDFIAALPVGVGLILAKDGAHENAARPDPRFSTPFPGAADNR